MTIPTTFAVFGVVVPRTTRPAVLTTVNTIVEGISINIDVLSFFFTEIAQLFEFVFDFF